MPRLALLVLVDLVGVLTNVVLVMTGHYLLPVAVLAILILANVIIIRRRQPTEKEISRARNRGQRVRSIRRMGYIYLACLVIFFASGSYRGIPPPATIFGCVFSLFLIGSHFYYAHKIAGMSEDEWSRRLEKKPQL